MTEPELIDLAKSGDGKAFKWLLKPHRKYIYQIVWGFFGGSEKNKDVVADIILKIYCNLHKYRSDYKFATWYNTMARNHCIDMVRKKKVDTVNMDDEDLDFYIGGNREDEIIKNEENIHVRYLLSLLPKRLYGPVYLLYFEGKKHTEIAMKLNMPVGTVKMNIHRAIEALRSLHRKTA